MKSFTKFFTSAICFAATSANAFDLSHTAGVRQRRSSSLPDQYFTGNNRYVSPQSYNMLNGGVSFTVDLSAVNFGVNAAMYLISPEQGNNNYCDIQCPSGNCCMELDILESNGHTCGQITLHTFNNGQWETGSCANGACQCNQGGCWSLTEFWPQDYAAQGCKTTPTVSGNINTSQSFDVNVTFDGNGNMKVVFSQSGNYETVLDTAAGTPSENPNWNGNDIAQIKNIMQSNGAKFVVSLWQGWSPGECSGSWGNLYDSTVKVTNIQVTSS
eukprot:Pgem_evm1s3166